MTVMSVAGLLAWARRHRKCCVTVFPVINWKQDGEHSENSNGFTRSQVAGVHTLFSSLERPTMAKTNVCDNLSQSEQG